MPTYLGPKPQTIQKLQRLVQLQVFTGASLYGTYTFTINPESYQQTEMGRIQVFQTLGGGFADLWGPALIQAQMSGTTGLQRIQFAGEDTDGYERFQNLLSIIRQMWSNPIKQQAVDWHFYLYNWTDDQYFEVLPLQNSWVQSVPEQLIFRYTLQFIALRDLARPSYVPPYAVRSWFTKNTAISAQDAAIAATNAANRVEALIRGLNAPNYVPSWAQAWAMQAYPTATTPGQAVTWFLSYLLPTDLPLPEVYPGIGNVTANMTQLLENTAYGILQQVSSGGNLPYQVNYSDVVSLANQASSLLASLEALGSVPMQLDASWGEFTDQVQALTLFPEVFTPIT